MTEFDLSILKKDNKIFNYENLDDCLKDTSYNVELIVALLMCYGFFDIKVKKDDNVIIFLVSYNDSEENVLVQFSLNSKTISGYQSEQIRLTYKTIQAIENQLSEHVLFPPELRRKSVENVCKNIGITLDQFSIINRNWPTIN